MIKFTLKTSRRDLSNMHKTWSVRFPCALNQPTYSVMAHSSVSTDMSEVYEVSHIIKQRRNHRGKLEYLVRWKNCDSDDDTWEPVENMRNCMDLLDDFNELHLKEKGPFAKASPPRQKTKASKQRHLNQVQNDFKRHNKTAPKISHNKNRVPSKRKCPFNDKIVIRKERKCVNGEQYYTCNGLSGSMAAPKTADEQSPSSRSLTSTSSATDVKIFSSTNVKKFHRPRSVSCMTYDYPVTSADANHGGPDVAKRRRVNSLHIRKGDKSVDSPTTTPPSTPTSSDVRLTVSPLLTPVIKLHDLKSGSLFKLPSPKSLLSTEKFLRAKLHRKDYEVADRFAENLALQRFSQSSLSSEDEDETERRFSLRQCDNVFNYKEIVVKKNPEYTQVWFFTNSPSRNALNIKALQELTDILKKSAKDETRVLLLTGSGNIFCSGLDLQELVVSDQRKKYARNLAEALRVFTNAMINFPKVIVAAVNGSAVGLGAAILPLCDIVYSSDKAEFHLPYAAIGQPPEGCSSFTFPNAMGLPVACDLLYSGRRMTALEACASGLVSQVLWPTSFMREVIPRVKIIAGNSIKGLQMTKSLVRSHLKAKLEYTNESECVALQERWASSECLKLIRKHLELK